VQPVPAALCAGRQGGCGKGRWAALFLPLRLRFKGCPPPRSSRTARRMCQRCRHGTCCADGVHHAVRVGGGEVQGQVQVRVALASMPRASSTALRCVQEGLPPGVRGGCIQQATAHWECAHIKTWARAPPACLPAGTRMPRPPSTPWASGCVGCRCGGGLTPLCEQPHKTAKRGLTRAPAVSAHRTGCLDAARASQAGRSTLCLQGAAPSPAPPPHGPHPHRPPPRHLQMYSQGDGQMQRRERLWCRQLTPERIQEPFQEFAGKGGAPCPTAAASQGVKRVHCSQGLPGPAGCPPVCLSLHDALRPRHHPTPLTRLPACSAPRPPPCRQAPSPPAPCTTTPRTASWPGCAACGRGWRASARCASFRPRYCSRTRAWHAGSRTPACRCARRSRSRGVSSHT